MISNKTHNPVVTEPFIRGRKQNISLVLITQSYFKVTKDYFIMKIPSKREFQQTAINHSSDIGFKDFMKIYKKCIVEPYSFLVNDTTLSADSPLFDCNWTRTHNHLVHKRTLNHLAKQASLAKWLSVRL